MRHYHVLGDSITYYAFPYLEQAVAGRIYVTRKGMGVYYDGDMNTDSIINGGDSACVRNYLLHDAPDFDVLVFNCGLHDIKTVNGVPQQTAMEYRDNLEAVLSQMESAGKPVIWMSSTPVDDALHAQRCKDFSRSDSDVRAYNAIAHKVMAAHGVPEIDLHTFTAQFGGSEIYRDHVHFTEEICCKQAEYVASCLLRFEQEE